jgi:SPP1 family phage portal protein
MYYSANDLINIKLMADKAQLNSDILADLIESDQKSTKKQNMVKGENYFFGQHDYLTHKRYYYVDKMAIENTQSANTLAAAAFHMLLVNQKVDHIKDIGYSIKEPEVLDEENPTAEESQAIKSAEELRLLLKNILGKKFNKEINKIIKGSSNKGVDWLHPYINKKGEFCYTIVDAKQIIPIYDTQYQDKLTAIIRYYTYEAINTQTQKTETRYKLEWWNDSEIKYWEQQIDKTFISDMFYPLNPAPHWTTKSTARPDETIKHSWGRPPFIPIPNNSDWTTDLEKVKAQIDCFDKIYCGWGNDLIDFQEMILVLKNVQSLTDEQKKGLSEIAALLQQIKENKIILTDTDGGAEALKMEIPVEAKDRFLKLTREIIFTLGQGVDPAQIGDGNITNVVIQARYAGLNMKCDSFLQELESGLTEFMWFVVEWINQQNRKTFNYEDIEFTFKIAEVINESDKIIDAISVFNTGALDERTFLENIPFIKNVDEVLKRLEADRARKQEESAIDLEKYRQMNPQNGQTEEEQNKETE